MMSVIQMRDAYLVLPVLSMLMYPLVARSIVGPGIAGSLPHNFGQAASMSGLLVY